MSSVNNTLNYYLDDFQKTIFPLDTNRLVIQKVPRLISDYIYQKILNEKDLESHFLPQTKCHAAKHGLHLRRTFKLDPVSDFYIYDLIYRNRASFRKDFSENRKSFGHRFENGKPISLSHAFRNFKNNVSECKKEFSNVLKIDIASYFNSLYHHDVVKWFDNDRPQKDVLGLGQFLREINSGRSVDCLPQGLHPCKVIGSEFLKFIDNHRFLKSEMILRFMDDIFLFSNEEEKIRQDFILIQQLAGEKGLNFNSAKTKLGVDALEDINSHIEKVRKELLVYRYDLIQTYDGEEEIEYEDTLSLDKEKIEYLYDLLHNPDLDELDAELILTFMGENGDDVLEYLAIFFDKFPNLSKRVFYFCKNIPDKTSLANLIKNQLSNGSILTEEQLFWFAKICEEYLDKTNEYSDILVGLLEHKDATCISKSKVLEMEEQRFGLSDLREEHLRVGKADWLAWSSAVGTRGMSKNNRNHILKYFSNVSQMNYIIATAVMEL